MVNATAEVVALVDTTTIATDELKEVDSVDVEMTVVNDDEDEDFDDVAVVEGVKLRAELPAASTVLSAVCSDESWALRLVAAAPVAVAATEEMDARVECAPAS